MPVVSAEYAQLLAATIDHLERLKARGRRFVNVSPENLAALARGTAAAPLPQPRTRAPDLDAGARFSLNPVEAVTGAPAIAPARITPSPALPATPLPAIAIAAPDSPKAVALAELRTRALACVKCPHLASSRKHVVFGVGNAGAELMFVGEAPGADEDAQGEPFVGAAGQLLTRIIKAMGLEREHVYIANILKCRPDTPDQRTGNRKPRPEEMQTCLPWLQEQIQIIQPRVMVALGATAVDGLLGKTIGITRLRGHWQSYQNVPLMPTFHPAYLLRQEQAGPRVGQADKRKVWEDMLQVMDRLGLPITDKQRGYFTGARA
jgi:DNA polymerase